MGKVARLDYCQFLFVSQIKSTLTYFAEHTERFSQGAARRYLQSEQIIPQLVRENVCGQVVQTPNGYMVFDDTVLDKNSSFDIELVRRQHSGDIHGLARGIGVVACVYVN
jgi:hypothetical protein